MPARLAPRNPLFAPASHWATSTYAAAHNDSPPREPCLPARHGCRFGAVPFEAIGADLDGAMGAMSMLPIVLWNRPSSGPAASGQLRKNGRVATCQHTHCKTHKEMGRSAGIALTKRNIGIVVTSIWPTMPYEICGGRRRITCCRPSTCTGGRVSGLSSGWAVVGVVGGHHT